MGAAFPELSNSRERVSQVLRQEEERFAETLEKGMGVLEGALASGDKLLDGETAFRLYDTFGFPVDLTADICRERGVMLDMAGFEAAMAEQRERARKSHRFAAEGNLQYAGAKTEFRGYETLKVPASIVALYREGSASTSLKAGNRASSCSTRRRSTPSRAARWATEASSWDLPARFRSRIRNASSPTYSATMAC
jgi:alanyl-tRNA synthetase